MRLIDADSLKSVVDSRVYHNHNGIIKIIDEQPTLDMQPVVHAHWTEDSYGYSSCSGCGFTFNWPDYKTEFCPCCGAKMDYTI